MRLKRTPPLSVAWTKKATPLRPRHALLQVLRPQSDCRTVPSDRPVGLWLSR